MEECARLEAQEEDIMSIIDTILDFFGLQRKSTHAPQTAPSQPASHEESAVDASYRKQREASERIVTQASDAAADLVSAIFERRTARIRELAQQIRDGSISQEEFEKEITALLGAGSAELSPEIQQALRDALEKRGREDQDEP
jgi:hypothetical protein